MYFLKQKLQQWFCGLAEMKTVTLQPWQIKTFKVE